MAKDSCFSVVCYNAYNKSGKKQLGVAEHHWVGIHIGSSVVMIDPWLSGGTGNLDDATATTGWETIETPQPGSSSLHCHSGFCRTSCSSRFLGEDSDRIQGTDQGLPLDRNRNSGIARLVIAPVLAFGEIARGNMLQMGPRTP